MRKIWPERISNFLPRKIWRPFEFCVCITANGTTNFKSALLEFRKNFGLAFSRVLARRPESLTWDFREWEILVTLFISIFVCFTPPLIFLEPLKLASWNFHTACICDGANSVLSHRWLAPIGANGGGSKYGVNFGIFKNHSGGPRGGQISTGRFQIYTYGGGWPFT